MNRTMQIMSEIWTPMMFTVWGYAVAGDGEFSADLAETGETYEKPPWDEPSMLQMTRLNGKRPADWHACYWIGEHIRRGHAALP